MLEALLGFAALAEPAVELKRFSAPEAHQGVAAGERLVYAIDNSAIAAYDKTSAKRILQWRDDPATYPHINSCTVVGANLVCAASNYPDVPMASSVETFEAATLKPVSSHSLGRGRGSLTWLDWKDGRWWACFANYDERGGQPGRDHRWTTVVRYSPQFVEEGAWLLPAAVLDRIKPRSSSGGAWGSDGLLYVTGHDAPEIYALRLPRAGTTLDLVAIIRNPTRGQAFDWDPQHPRMMWSIDRETSQIVASNVPALP